MGLHEGRDLAEEDACPFQIIVCPEFIDLFLSR
jgi:hypothetical protein